MNHEITLKAEMNKTIPKLLNRETTDKEALYQELQELCLELGIPYMESHIDIMYGYPDEAPKRLETYPQRCHSWVRSAYNQMMACLGSLNLSDASPNWGTGYMNVKNTVGTIISGATVGFADNSNPASNGAWLKAAVNVDDYSILVGSSATAESFEHYNLQSQLTEPSYTHAATGNVAFVQDGLTSKVSYSRQITNASGGQATFREVGLFAVVTLGGGDNWVMLARDLIIPALTLNNTGYITPTYTFALTYPS